MTPYAQFYADMLARWYKLSPAEIERVCDLIRSPQHMSRAQTAWVSTNMAHLPSWDTLICCYIVIAVNGGTPGAIDPVRWVAHHMAK